MRRRKKPHTVTESQVTIPIYRTQWRDKKRRRIYRKNVIIWADTRGRHRESHADFATADRRAHEIARSIANGQASLQSISPADWATYQRCAELLRPLGKSLELAISEYVDDRNYLADHAPAATVREALAFFARHQPPAGSPQACPDILIEMIRIRRKDGAAQNTLDDLESRVGRFCKDFTGPLGTITAHDIDDWLARLDCSNRTRNNYRGNLVDFYRFAHRRGYLPKTWRPMDDVPRVKDETVRIETFTPEEVTMLLRAARARDLRAKNKPVCPYLAVALFGGVRNEEMCAQLGTNGKPLPVLDWREVDFDAREIRVLPEVARKIGRDRIFPMQDNLVAWLQLYAKPNGPVCDLRNIVNVLAELATDAGVPWKDNGPRKTYISSRLPITKNIGQVAQEAGTSAERINRNYKKTIPEREAKRHFDIFPTTAAILQLNFLQKLA